ncbi:MAG: DUF853 family protein, partial [Acidobacteria bacterium]
SKYDKPVNRESAYEMLKAAAGSPPHRPDTATVDSAGARTLPRRSGEAAEAGSPVNDFLWGTKRRQGMVETMAKQAARTVGGQLGRQILRGVLGGILGGRRVR